MRTPDPADGPRFGRLNRPMALILTMMSWAMMLGAPLAGGCAGDEIGPANQPPRLTLDVGAAESYVVGDFIQIRANAEDPDGDEMTFSVVGLPARADLHTFANSALMSWDPIASDVTGDEPLRLVFVVEDDRGGRAERVVNMTISAGNSAPVFTSPSSKLYDPTSRHPLKFEVKVRADAAHQVTLTMPAQTAPQGAEFEQTGPKTAEFSWKPNAEQRERRVHSVVFVADDGLGAAVEQKVAIVFQENGGGGGPSPSPTPDSTCQEERPITHGSPGPQRTLDDYELRAHLSEAAAARYDEGFIFWTVDEPMNYEVEFNVVEMKVGNGLMRGGIPNLLLTAGETQTVFYTICAMDSDADPDDAQGFICAPPGYYYSFVAYSPGATQCVDDALAGSDFSDAVAVPETQWGGYRICAGGADYHQVSAAAGELVEVYLLYTLDEMAEAPPAHGLALTVYDETHTPQDVAVISDCEGMAYLALQAPPSAAKTWYIEVKSKDGAELPYEIGAIRADSGEACVDDDRFGRDNRDINGAEPVSSETYQDLQVCADQPDWYYAWVGAGQILLLEVLVEDGATVDDVYLDVYDFDGVWLDEAFPEEGRLGLEFTAPDSGIYHFTVDSALDIRYTLTVMNEADEPGPTCVDDDAFGSENHDFFEAKVILSGTYEGLTLCADQPDWYYAGVEAGETVLAELSVEDGPTVNDVYLDVYDYDRNWLQEAFPQGDSLELDFVAPHTGTYIFRVDAPADTRYTLTFFNQSDP